MLNFVICFLNFDREISDMFVIFLQGNLHLIGKIVSLHIGNKMFYFLFNVNLLYYCIKRLYLNDLSLSHLRYLGLLFYISCESASI